jgi:signal transduction histidine kinase
MHLEDDLDLAAQYYRLRGQHIFYRHTLDNYRRYGALAPVLAQFSSLCGGFVHDLGNGLNAIRSKLERLSTEQAVLPPEHAQAIARAKALCDSCGWRLYALHEVSPSPPIHPEPANLPEFIPRLLDTLTAWQPPSVQVEFHTTQSRLIVADYDCMVRLALLETLLNAFQAMPQGGQISVFLQKLDSGLAQIEIADTGPGLPPGDPEQCFDLRFTSGPHRYGMGLCIARKVVEKHRGTLTLRSEPGRGTRVIIQLPVGNPEPDWEDDSALVRELESLHDSVAGQKREIETCQAAYALPREQLLSQLSDLFGQLSASPVEFLETGIAGIRRLLAPLSGQMTGEAAGHVQLILEKCDYCDIVAGNARALDPTSALHPTSLDLNQIASQVVQLMAWRAQPGTQLHLSQATGLPLVQADGRLIATTFLNLLRNALDVAGKDGRVEVQTSFIDEAIVTRFTNTGQTIPPDVQTHVFDLDYTTRKGRAFGLGLYVARTIVARHNGAITVQNRTQSQITLNISIPAQERDTP